MAGGEHELMAWPNVVVFSTLTKDASGWSGPGMTEGVRGGQGGLGSLSKIQHGLNLIHCLQGAGHNARKK
jgi:hypothetical protein